MAWYGNVKHSKVAVILWMHILHLDSAVLRSAGTRRKLGIDMCDMCSSDSTDDGSGH